MLPGAVVHANPLPCGPDASLIGYHSNTALYPLQMLVEDMLFEPTHGRLGPIKVAGEMCHKENGGSDNGPADGGWLFWRFVSSEIVADAARVELDRAYCITEVNLAESPHWMTGRRRTNSLVLSGRPAGKTGRA